MLRPRRAFLLLSTASETGSDYHPIFFNQDRLLEELFCVCIQLLNKTWKEMRATQEDFDKVNNMTICNFLCIVTPMAVF